MIRGIIVYVEIGDIVRIHIRRGENKDIIELPFFPVIYVRERDFYRFEKIFGDIIIDTEYSSSSIGFSERCPVVGIKVSYNDYLRLRRIYRMLSFEIFHLDMYIEHMVVRVPSLNPVDLKIKDGKICGEYLWGIRPEVPPELKIYYVYRGRNMWFIEDIHGYKETFASLMDFLEEHSPDIVISKHRIPGEDILKIHPEDTKYGIEGILEKAYFTYAMPKRLVSLTIGNAVESRQTHFALERGIILPQKENPNTYLGDIDTYKSVDVGGLIMTPDPGIYENVVALDFTSLFPHIIVRYNISYENTFLDGVRNMGGVGFLPSIVAEPLERRKIFKKMDNIHARNRARMLKLLLVSCYGYAGKSDNRFGNFLINFWINKYSREILLSVIDKAKSLGFRVLYADTDSIFIQGSREKIRLIVKYAEELGFPLVVEYDFKKIAFIRGRDGRPVVKRYYGITRDGNIVIKGLMAVRSNVPRIVRIFQRELIWCILTKNTVPESLLEEYVEKIIRNPDISELRAVVRFGKNAAEYKNNSWIARLAWGSKAKRGEKLEILYTQTGAVPYRLKKYSIRKYISLLQAAYQEATSCLTNIYKL